MALAWLVQMLPEPLRGYLTKEDETGLVAQWLPLVLMVAAMIVPAIYSLLFGKKQPRTFLNPTEWKVLPLMNKEVVSHNVRRFRFALPTKDMVLGLPVGAHVSFKATDEEGKLVMRPYTPVSDDTLRGYVDFVIKVYPQGKMSQCLERLQIGDRLAFKGPRGRLQYKPNMKRALGMVAGGSGITPMFQVALAILRSQQDGTTVHLVYANVAEGDILLRQHLDAWARVHADRFKVYYVLEKPPEGWSMGEGYVSHAMLAEHLPAPAEDVLILRCGPPAMNKAVEGILDASGYSKDMQFEF